MSKDDAGQSGALWDLGALTSGYSARPPTPAADDSVSAARASAPAPTPPPTSLYQPAAAPPPQTVPPETVLPGPTYPHPLPPGALSLPRPTRAGPPQTVLIVAATAVAALVLSIGGIWFALRRSPDGATTIRSAAASARTITDGGAAQPQTEPDGGHAGPDEPATSDPTAAENDQATQELERIREQDLATVSIDGRYVAQLASKYDGIVDPLQAAADGSHTFRARDILTEHQSLRSSDNQGAAVVLLLSTDYGKRQLVDGHPLWVTFALGSFATRDEVLSWCAARFSNLTGNELTNACAPRTLEPPQ